MTPTIVKDGALHWEVEPVKGVVSLQLYFAPSYKCLDMDLSLDVARQLGDALNKASDIAEAQRALKGGAS